MREILVFQKVLIDGIGHYIDPFLPDNDRTWCGLPIQPYIYRGWQAKTQKCEDCQKKWEGHSVQ